MYNCLFVIINNSISIKKMSFFRTLFGQKKEESKDKAISKKDEIRKAIQDLDIREKEITTKIDSLRKQCDFLFNTAKEVMTVNPKSEVQKSMAEKYMKKRKLLQKEIDALSGAEERLMEQRISLETQLIQMDTLKVMDKANKLIPKIDTESATKVIDEASNRVQDAEEVSDLFKTPLGTSIDVNDEMNELEEMMREEVKPNQSEGLGISFPEVPKTPVKISTPTQIKKDISFDRELANLTAL
jgi:hypothetical protein